MTKKKLVKLKIGAPTKYDPKYCKEIIAFFSEEPYRKKEISHTNSKGEECTEYKEVANDPPFLSAFARKIKVDSDTLVEWCTVHPEFSVAYKHAKSLQTEFIATNALKGLYAQPFSIFTAKNVMGWRDVQEVAHSGEVTISKLVKQAHADYKRQQLFSKN